MIIKKKNDPSIKINKKNAYKYTCYQHFNDGMILPWTMIIFKFLLLFEKYDTYISCLYIANDYLIQDVNWDAPLLIS